MQATHPREMDMHTWIKCGYVGVGMLLAFLISNWIGILEPGGISILVIGGIGGGLGYLFVSLVFSSSLGQVDEVHFHGP
jgi:hypothetical protein